MTTRSTPASSIIGSSLSMVNGSGSCGLRPGTHGQAGLSAFHKWTCASTIIDPLSHARWKTMPPRVSGDVFKPKHALRIPETNLLYVRLRQIKRFHHCDGRADIAPALFLVERAVRGKQDMIRSEE